MARIIGKRVGRRIKVLRIREGLSQAALAERLKVETETISRWERGVRLPDLDRLGDVAEVLGTDLDGFLSGMLQAPGTTGEEIARIVALLEPLPEDHLRAIRTLLGAHLAAVDAAQGTDGGS